MYVYIIVLFCFVTTPASVTSALRNIEPSSSRNLTIYHRYKRQAGCPLFYWQCTDGTCISIDGQCDGKIDCPDGSDETHALCRKTKCQRNWFRCTYGACVDGSAPCNGSFECADQSDELLPRCQKDSRIVNGKFRCADGNNIPATDQCDGNPDCPDGSDETIRACAGQKCQAHLFQCAYGACVDQHADCNGRNECADGSDESSELCDKKLATTNANKPIIKIPQTGKCLLPPYPAHGIYVVTNAPNGKPGQRYPYAHLNVTCNRGYNVIGNHEIFCQDGAWSHPIPDCVQFCKLDPNPSVRHYCVVSGDVEGYRACNSYEPSGTTIRPECNRPNYFSDTPLRYMRCIGGEWDYIAACNPDCGQLTPDVIDLIIGGRPAKRAEVPWHIGIYRKPTKSQASYEQICGGSLVTNRLVISAAHCFWNNIGLQEPASKYAVAAAKLFRDWNHPEDKDAQKSNVTKIELPALFLGSRGNFQEDIALLILETPFVYQPYLRPVCLSFSERFNDRQLQPGNFGKVAGWGYISESAEPSEVLKVVDLPFVDIRQCVKATPLTFTNNITGDKICAGYNNGTAALCKGDSGGGLAFPEDERDTVRYYLRGIVSTAPRGDGDCNAFTVTTFTQILKHEHFINKYL